MNMGYPSIPLNDKARKILTIVMPFGAYECLTLPMGVMPASDLFQARMVHIFAGMDERRPFPYIDDILHFKGDTFEQHLSILVEILGLIGKNSLQVSAEKSCFYQESVEYLVSIKSDGLQTTPVASQRNPTHQSTKGCTWCTRFPWRIEFYQESHSPARRDL